MATVGTEPRQTTHRPAPRGPGFVSLMSGLIAGGNRTLAQREQFGRLGSAVWVFFIAAPVAELLQRPFSPLHRGLTLLGVAVFLAIYLPLTLFPMALDGMATRRRRVGIGALYVLAITLSLTGGTPWLALFYYCESTFGWMTPRVAVRAIAATTALVLILAWMLDPAPLHVGGSVAQTALVGLLVLGMFQMIRTNAALHAAREEVARLAVAEERLRFARDLHDLLGHSLSLITLKSELAGQLVPVAPEQAVSEIGDIERVAREALREVREAVVGYRQPTLTAELANAHTVLDAGGIACEITDHAGTLPAAVDAVLAWTVREGVTNVIRHSRARHCLIRITRDAGVAVAEIADDGRGALHDAGKCAGSGLAGLRERAAMQGGSLEAGPIPAGGFRLRVAIPLITEAMR